MATMKAHEKFKSFLKGKGITQTEAGRKLGVTFQTISSWANGRGEPPGPAKIAVEAKLGFKWPQGRGA